MTRNKEFVTRRGRRPEFTVSVGVKNKRFIFISNALSAVRITCVAVRVVSRGHVCRCVLLDL